MVFRGWKEAQKRDIRVYKRRLEQQKKTGDNSNAEKTKRKIEEMIKNTIP